jgi:hypothetical protein
VADRCADPDPYYNNNYSLDLADLLPHNWKAGQVLQNAPLDTNNYWRLLEKVEHSIYFYKIKNSVKV